MLRYFQGDTMAHISELALLNYVSGRTDLTSAETEHLQNCDDCRNDVLELQRRTYDPAEIVKAHGDLDGESLPPVAELPEEFQHGGQG
jgi:hypothetical protein